jgi:hypothetical protein
VSPPSGGGEHSPVDGCGRGVFVIRLFDSVFILIFDAIGKPGTGDKKRLIIR